MHVHDVLRTEYLAAETRDAVLAEFYDRQELCGAQPGNLGNVRDGLHVNDVSGADEVADAAARAFLDLDFFDHDRIMSIERRKARMRALLRVRLFSSQSSIWRKPRCLSARRSRWYGACWPAASQTMSIRRSRA